MNPQKAGDNREKPSEICARVEKIRARIEGACERVGRDASGVLLIGASKTVPIEILQLFLKSGLENCGENYVQEGIAKSGVLQSAWPNSHWHLIGALQSNKAREAVQYFDWIHSVDRISLIDALDKAARAQNKIQNVLLQINLGNEMTKSGCAIEDAKTLAALCREKENLKLCGLMCLPPFNENPENSRAHFRVLKNLRDEIFAENLNGDDGENDRHLSMGMSHDFEIAIEEGATMIRVGTALFGAR